MPRGDGQDAGVLHRVAGVDRQIEDRKLELVHVGQRSGQFLIEIEREGDRGADRLLQQLGHAPDQAVDVDRLGLELLDARKRQQLRGQLGAALGGLEGVLGQARDARIGGARPDQVEIADHRGEQIVEIVRQPAGQLPDRFHLLRLHQRRLGLPALGDFLAQPRIGLDQLNYAILHPLFQRRIERPQRVFALPDPEQSADAGRQFQRLGRLDQEHVGAGIE